MPVEPADLATALCRAVMRDLDDQPILLELLRPGTVMTYDYEATTAAKRMAAGQYCAVLLPVPGFVSVRAHLKFHGLGFHDRAVLSPGDGEFEELIFVRYPDDPALIIGPEYEAELRAAVGKALAAIEESKEKADD